jgi:hypothetical protein
MQQTLCRNRAPSHLFVRCEARREMQLAMALGLDRVGSSQRADIHILRLAARELDQTASPVLLGLLS